eukprot:gene729-137_t
MSVEKTTNGYPGFVDRQKKMKYLVVSGGTVSGLGKGTAISSMGVVLQSLGLRVTALKIDPYLNIDAGTMSPFEHGEVFVLDDGGEVDLDLGNYERHLGVNLQSCHSITTGKIYQRVIERERKGEYLGKTVQVIPHITNCLQEWIEEVAYISVDGLPGPPDVCLIELGGTVGDIESAMFLEGLQQMQCRIGKENFVHVHLGMLPVLGATGEQKTKPTQHSVKLLREAGHCPDFLLCRCEEVVESAVRKKLAMFCQVPEDHVISMHDVKNTYHVPLLMWQQGLDEKLSKRLGLAEIIKSKVPEQMPNLNKLIRWKLFVDKINTLHETVTIGLVGKYTGLSDSYMSVMKALQHACIEADLDLAIEWIESSDLEPATRATNPQRYDSAWERLKGVDGVLVPGGFGDRGVEGKVCAARYCRQNQLPFFGICIGLQMAVIEFARTELSWEDANSTEFNEKTNSPVVINMPEISSTQMGGTMRLGSRVTIIKDQNSLASKIHEGKPVIYERHRHRYEVNPSHVAEYERRGLNFTGQDDRAQRMEIAELKDHPYFLCVQYHPEFKSRPMDPARTFLSFVLASAGNLDKRLQADGGVLKVHGIHLKPEHLEKSREVYVSELAASLSCQTEVSAA